MNSFSYRKLINFLQIKNSINECSDFEKIIGLSNKPFFVFNGWYSQYIQKSSNLLTTWFYFDYFQDSNKSLIELLNFIDSYVYLIQPIDVIEIKNWNPIKFHEKNYCHSEDVIHIKFIDYDSDKEYFCFSFKRSNYIKSNLLVFLETVFKKVEGKFLKINFSYSVSEEGKNLNQKIINELNKLNLYDFGALEKTILNFHFNNLISEDLLNQTIPENYIQESYFIDKLIQSSDKFKENQLLLKEYINSRQIEILFIINHNFEIGPFVSKVDFLNPYLLLTEVCFKFFFKK